LIDKVVHAGIGQALDALMGLLSDRPLYRRKGSEEELFLRRSKNELRQFERGRRKPCGNLHPALNLVLGDDDGPGGYRDRAGAPVRRGHCQPSSEGLLCQAWPEVLRFSPQHLYKRMHGTKPTALRGEKGALRLKTVEFFFDFGSPYSYLASTQMEAVAERA